MLGRWGMRSRLGSSRRPARRRAVQERNIGKRARRNWFISTSAMNIAARYAAKSAPRWPTSGNRKQSFASTRQGDCIDRAVDCAAAKLEHARVDHHCRDICMAEQVLNRPYVIARQQEMSRERMSTRVRRSRLTVLLLFIVTSLPVSDRAGRRRSLLQESDHLPGEGCRGMAWGRKRLAEDFPTELMGSRPRLPAAATTVHKCSHSANSFGSSA